MEAERGRQYDLLVNQYYDLATEFYLFGWGKSFHFAPLQPGRPLPESVKGCEQFVALDLGLSRTSKVLDLGCGVGGPMMTIAGLTRAKITGINNNDYQVAKGREFVRKSGLGALCDFVKGDFMHMPFENECFDAAYSFEAVPHAPDRLALFKQVFRILRPGGHFAATDWCLTGRFDPDDPEQKRALTDLLRGNGLQGLASTGECVSALAGAGFEVLATRDLTQDCHPDTPWYSPLDGTGRGWRSLVRRPAGRRIVKNALSVLEKLRIVPRGSAFVQDFLGWGADALIALGRTGAFTPMYYIHGRKPEMAI